MNFATIDRQTEIHRLVTEGNVYELDTHRNTRRKNSRVRTGGKDRKPPVEKQNCANVEEQTVVTLLNIF